MIDICGTVHSFDNIGPSVKEEDTDYTNECITNCNLDLLEYQCQLKEYMIQLPQFNMITLTQTTPVKRDHSV